MLEIYFQNVDSGEVSEKGFIYKETQWVQKLRCEVQSVEYIEMIEALIICFNNFQSHFQK